MQFYTFLQLVKVILDYKQMFFASWKSKGLVSGSDQAIDPDPNWPEGESRSDEKFCSHRSRKKVSVIHRFIEAKTCRCTCLLFHEYQKMRKFFSIFCKLNPDPHSHSGSLKGSKWPQIRNRIPLMRGRIRIRINVKSRVRIYINVEKWILKRWIRIRIRIKMMRISNQPWK